LDTAPDPRFRRSGAVFCRADSVLREVGSCARLRNDALTCGNAAYSPAAMMCGMPEFAVLRPNKRGISAAPSKAAAVALHQSTSSHEATGFRQVRGSAETSPVRHIAQNAATTRVTDGASTAPSGGLCRGLAPLRDVRLGRWFVRHSILTFFRGRLKSRESWGGSSCRCSRAGFGDFVGSPASRPASFRFDAGRTG
jgi:hypothetical protein